MDQQVLAYAWMFNLYMPVLNQPFRLGLWFAGVHSTVFCVVVWSSSIDLASAGCWMVYWHHDAWHPLGVGSATLAGLGLLVRVSGQVGTLTGLGRQHSYVCCLCAPVVPLHCMHQTCSFCEHITVR